MDKLTEAHLNVLSPLTGIVKIENLAPGHATITREYMGRFAEWENYNFNRHRNGGWYSIADYNKNGRPTKVYTTSELIELFEKENV